MPGCLGPHVFRRAKIGKRCIYCTEFHPVPLFSGAVYLLTTFQGTTESCDFLRLESTALGQFPPLQTALLTLFALDIRPWNQIALPTCPSSPLLPTSLLGGRVPVLCARFVGRGRKQTKSVLFKWWLPDHCWLMTSKTRKTVPWNFNFNAFVIILTLSISCFFGVNKNNKNIKGIKRFSVPGPQCLTYIISLIPPNYPIRWVLL